MPEIILVRQHDLQITDAEREAARKVIFGFLDGLGDRGQKQWRQLWNGLLSMEPGEMVSIKTHKQRLGWYQRKHMALETAIFKGQETFANFDRFRDWLKVGAGFIEWIPGAAGDAMQMVPRSIEYAKLEQGEMEAFHDDAVAYLRTDHAGFVLWPHASVTQRIELIEGLLGGFGE